METRIEVEILVNEGFDDEMQERCIDFDEYEYEYFTDTKKAVQYAKKKYKEFNFVIVREQTREPYIYNGVDIGEWEYSDTDPIWIC